MFFVYYIIVALFTFWAVATHSATRGKPFVALVSAAVMPFALPLIPIIGLVWWLIAKLRSPRATNRNPSWADELARVESFSEMVKARCESRGIPSVFTAAGLANATGAREVLNITGALERQGASFDEQVNAASDQIAKYWSRATPEQQEMARRETA